MGRVLTVFFGLLALGVVFLWCMRHANEIEAGVGAAAVAELRSADIDYATATASGQQVILTGTAATEADRSRAGNAVAQAVGVTVVVNEITVEAAAPPPGPDPTPMPAGVPEILLASFDGATATLQVSGQVAPSVEEPNRGRDLLSWLSEAHPQITVQGTLEPSATEQLDLRAPLEKLLEHADKLASAELEVTADTLRVVARSSALGGAPWADQAALAAAYDDVAAGRAVSARLLPPATTSAAAVAQCQQRFNALLTSEAVLFTISKAELRTASFALLDKLAAVAGDCPMQVVIAGHTDARGDPAMNERLSLARAEAVRDYLVEQGVAAQRLQPQGLGAAQPIGDNNTVAGRQQNRRIEFVVEGTNR